MKDPNMPSLTDLPEEVEKFAHLGSWDFDVLTNDLHWSGNLYKIFETTEKTFSGSFREFLNFVHPDDQVAVKDEIRAAIRNKADFSFTKKIISGKKNIKNISAWGQISYDEGGNVVRIKGLCQEIRVPAAQKRNFSDAEEQLRVFITYAPVSIAMFDRKMNYLACSERYLDDWWVHDEQMTPEKIKGLNHYELFPDVLPKWKASHQRALMGEVIKEDQVPFIKANGKKEWLRWKNQPWFLADGSVGGIILYTEFITEQKSAERALTESRNRLDALIQNLPGLVYRCDPHTFELNFVSSGSLGVTGYEQTEFFGSRKISFKQIAHPEDFEEVRSTLKKSIRSKQPFELTYRLYTKRGTIKYVTERGQAIYDQEGKPISIEGVVIDITKSKETEQQLADLTKELSRSNAELKQYAYITSHDLKSPVLNIDTLLSLYQDESADAKEKKLIFSKIESSIEQLKLTLKDLMYLVADESSTDNLIDVYFEEIVNAVTDSLETQIKAEDATIVTNFEIPAVKSRKSTVYSTLQNLISNALKYRKEDPLTIEISSRSNNDYIILSVRDNGLGIDLKRHQEQLFGMYQRFNFEKEGKGLGLYIIKCQIEALGGFIEVESNIGQGSTFNVYFKKY